MDVLARHLELFRGEHAMLLWKVQHVSLMLARETGQVEDQMPRNGLLECIAAYLCLGEPRLGVGHPGQVYMSGVDSSDVVKVGIGLVYKQAKAE